MGLPRKFDVGSILVGDMHFFFHSSFIHGAFQLGLSSFFFFGGLSIPVSQAILAHMFSYNMTWSATKKEVERSNFFKEGPKILKRFWFSLLVSSVVIVGVVIVATPLVPIQWRIGGEGWAVIFPLL